MEQNDFLNHITGKSSENSAGHNEDSAIEIKAVKKITDQRHLNLFEVQYLDRLGRERAWDIVSRNSDPKCITNWFDHPDAVVIVATHIETNKLVVIREFRVALGSYQYGFPAGLVDKDENIEKTASRELFEETGLKLEKILTISPPIYSSSGMTDESVSVVYAQCTGTPSKMANTSSEDIYTLMVSPREASDLLGDHTLKFDVKTWLVLSEYARTGKIF